MAEFDYEMTFKRLRARGEVTIVPSEVSRGYGPLRPTGGQVHLGYDPTVKITFTPHQDSPEQKKRRRDWYGRHGRIGSFMVDFFFSEVRVIEKPTLREAMEELLDVTRPRTGYLYEMVFEKQAYDREQDAHAAIWDGVALGLLHGEHAA